MNLLADPKAVKIGFNKGRGFVDIMRIMVLGDMPGTEMLAELLKEKFKFISIYSGRTVQDASRWANHQTFDLVIFNFESSNIKVGKEILNWNGLVSPTTSLLCTTDLKERSALWKAGFDVLLRPFSDQELCDYISMQAYKHARIEKLLLEKDTDSLTGFLKKDAFMQKVDELILQKRPFGFLLGDIDAGMLKNTNDTYDHSAGDQLMEQFGELVLAKIKHNDPLRDSDRAGRIGGDEFGVLLYFCENEDGLMQAAERIRFAVESNEFKFTHGGKKFTTGGTVSFGAFHWDPLGEFSNFSAADILKESDLALKVAKNIGKNCIVNFHRLSEDEKIAFNNVEEVLIRDIVHSGPDGDCWASLEFAPKLERSEVHYWPASLTKKPQVCPCCKSSTINWVVRIFDHQLGLKKANDFHSAFASLVSLHPELREEIDSRIIEEIEELDRDRKIRNPRFPLSDFFRAIKYKVLKKGLRGTEYDKEVTRLGREFLYDLNEVHIARQIARKSIHQVDFLFTNGWKIAILPKGMSVFQIGFVLATDYEVDIGISQDADDCNLCAFCYGERDEETPDLTTLGPHLNFEDWFVAKNLIGCGNRRDPREDPPSKNSPQSQGELAALFKYLPKKEKQ